MDPVLKGRRARLAIVVLLVTIGFGVYLQQSIARSQEELAKGLQAVFIRPLESALQPIGEIGKKYDVVVAPQAGGKMLIWGRSVRGMQLLKSASELRTFLKGVSVGTAFITSAADEELPHPALAGSPQEQEKTMIELKTILVESGFHVSNVSNHDLGPTTKRQQ